MAANTDPPVDAVTRWSDVYGHMRGGVWPEPFAWWMTEYPVGRGQQQSVSGWTCPGCGHGYSPMVRECAHCPATTVATGTNAQVPDDEDYER